MSILPLLDSGLVALLALDDSIFLGSEKVLDLLKLRSVFKLADRKSTRLNSSHSGESRMPSSA